MRRLLKVLLCLVILLLLRFFLSFVVNEYIIYNYNNKNYKSILINSLYILNINQPYIAYYNDGNISYRLNDYNDAIDHYEKALTKNPPKSKVCDIRINLSLAMIKNINTTDSQLISSYLEEAKKNLYQDNCADENSDNGKSKEAEKLEDEISKIQKQLDNSNKDNNSSSDDSKIEEDIKKIQSNARSSREEQMSSYENLGKYSYYSGKPW